jgi:hypothetical protein
MKSIKGKIVLGKVELEAEGFVGTACVEATREYLERLTPNPGDKDTQYKDAYHQQEIQETA